MATKTLDADRGYFFRHPKDGRTFESCDLRFIAGQAQQAANQYGVPVEVHGKATGGKYSTKRPGAKMKRNPVAHKFKPYYFMFYRDDRQWAQHMGDTDKEAIEYERQIYRDKGYRATEIKIVKFNGIPKQRELDDYQRKLNT